MGIGFAKELGTEAQHTIADQKNRRHLPLVPPLARVQPQQHEQQNALPQKLIELRWMARHIASAAKHHAPRQVGTTDPPPQFSIDEVANPSRRQAGGYTGSYKVGNLQPGPAA